MTNAVSIAQGGSNNVTMRNRIINGAMMIDQRNAGASVTPTNAYTLDRWTFSNTQASKISIQQNAGSVTPPIGFSNYLGATSLSAYSVTASDTFLITQSIEAFNFYDLAWGTSNAKAVTISFWASSSLTGAFGGCLTNYTSTQAYPFSYSIPVANTWTYCTITIPGCTTGSWGGASNTGAATLRFGLGSGSNFTGTAGTWTTGNLVQPPSTVSVVGTNGATFYVTGVQLEAGTKATPFEYLDYGRQLIQCQRYYQQYTQPPLRGSVASATNIGRAGMVLPVVMRAAPTATVGALPAYDGAVTGSVTGITGSYCTPFVAELDLSTTNAPFTIGRAGIIFQTGTEKMTLSAEL